MSPRIHQAFAEQTEEAVSYQAIEVPLGGFSEAVAAFQNSGGKGINITLPFKGEAFTLADQASSVATTAAAVNTIYFDVEGRRVGDNTDGSGLLRDLDQGGIRIQDQRLLVMGAGGAVRGVLGPLLEREPRRLLICNRDADKARALVRLFAPRFQVDIASAGYTQLGAMQFDVIINGTSASLSGELPPLPDGLLAEGGACYDMVYLSTETVFTRWARRAGARVARDGLGMLVEQAAESFNIWRGVRPDTAPVHAMLRDELRAASV